MTTPEERKAADEGTFREANERIREAEHEQDPPLDRVPYLCECEDTSCREPIRLERDEYERVRSDPTWFVLVSGHPTTGEVVRECDDYVIARKTGEAAEVAVGLDPRGEDR